MVEAYEILQVSDVVRPTQYTLLTLKHPFGTETHVLTIAAVALASSVMFLLKRKGLDDVFGNLLLVASAFCSQLSVDKSPKAILLWHTGWLLLAGIAPAYRGEGLRGSSPPHEL